MERYVQSDWPRLVGGGWRGGGVGYWLKPRCKEEEEQQQQQQQQRQRRERVP